MVGADTEFEIFGVDLNQRVTRMKEGIQTVRKAWDAPVPTSANEITGLNNVSIMPKPIKKASSSNLGGCKK